MNMKIVRGQVWKVNLDPTRGAEMKAPPLRCCQCGQYREIALEGDRSHH